MNTFALLFAIVADAALKATVLLALAWTAARALKNRSSACRHMVRAFALGAVLALLLLSSFLPGWKVRGIPEIAPSHTQQNAQGAHPSTPFPTQTATVPTMRVAAAPKLTREKVGLAPVMAVEQQQPESTSPAPAATRSAAPISPSVQWTQLLGAIWLVGLIVCLWRMMMSRLQLMRLARNSVPVKDRDWIAQLHSVAQALDIRGVVILLKSMDTEVPFTTGGLCPKIILPAEHIEWTSLRRSAVLQHELAHIKRRDAVTQSIADLAAALYWFHPLVWTTAMAIRAERERACDDYVLALGAKPSEYAHELLEIASSLRQPALGAALAMARRSHLEGRLTALLNPALPRGSVSPRVALAMAALTLGIVCPLAAMRAAQQSKPSPSTGGQAPAPSQHPTAPGSLAKPSTDDEDGIETPEPPEPPEPPISMPPDLTRSHELAELRARLAERQAQAELLKSEASSKNRDRLAEIQVHIAQLRERISTLQASAAPPAPGIPGGVHGGIPGGVPAVPGVPGVPGTPSVPAVPPAPNGDLDICGTDVKLHNMSVNSDNGHKHWTAYWSGDDCSIDLRADGNIEFNAEATEIQSISVGGFFEVDQRQGNTWKHIRVTPSGNGLEYAYKVNGADQPFDAQAKAWFSDFILELERSTGFAAESRVRKLLEKGGPPAVLEEINHLRGDYVRGIYFRKLLDQPNLPSAVVVRIINQADEQVGGDYEKARILMEVARQYSLGDETSQAAFLKAAGSLKSDYEHSRVLIELLKRPNISGRDVELALHSAAGIHSDYEKSRILLSLLEQKSFDQSYLDFYLKMVASIQSDYEKSRDLLAPMQKYPLDQKQINQILDASANIGSDYEKSRLLTGLVNQGKFDEKQMAEYLKVVASVGSDYERSRSLMALMEHNPLSNNALAGVLDATSHIGSSYEKSRVLLAVAQKYPLEGALRDQYIRIANSLSEYERNRALGAIAKRAAI